MHFEVALESGAVFCTFSFLSMQLNCRYFVAKFVSQSTISTNLFHCASQTQQKLITNK